MNRRWCDNHVLKLHCTALPEVHHITELRPGVEVFRNDTVKGFSGNGRSLLSIQQYEYRNIGSN